MNSKDLLMYRGLILLLSVVIVALCWCWYHSGSYEKECCQAEKTCCPNANQDATFIVSETVQDSIKLPQPNLCGATLRNALENRRTVRSFKSDALSDQQISNLLWSALGENREDGKRTAPTARNAQEIDAYLFTTKAIYYYQASSHSLKLFKEGDFKKNAGRQAFYESAPIAISLVVDFKNMADFDEESKQFYSATDAGYVSQNIYLFCANAGLATVACGNIDRPLIQEMLDLKDGKALLSHPVGYEQ